VAAGDRPFETALTLILADQAPALAEAHDELYPERIPEHIPLSLTLLYPFAPVPELKESHLERVRAFFESRPPLTFDLTHLAQWEDGGAVYAVPEPDEDLRTTMRGLWRLFPEFPPYRVPNSDPPPHASLTLTDHGDRAGTRARAEQRLEGLLPAHFELTEVALMQEYALDRMRVTHTFQLAGGQGFIAKGQQRGSRTGWCRT
jgi:2'-5' RNA ligase superfamily protein